MFGDGTLEGRERWAWKVVKQERAHRRNIRGDHDRDFMQEVNAWLEFAEKMEGYRQRLDEWLNGPSIPQSFLRRKSGRKS